MSVETARAYWDQGVAHVPAMTGAATLLDARDLVDLAEELGIALPLPSVLDVGCGTGRIAKHCLDYVGVDIAPSAVVYCTQAGLQAHLIAGPEDLPAVTPHWVTCLSVFTHLPQPQRWAYLSAFIRLAPNLLVDVIPGDGSGEIALWTADLPTFQASLAAIGYRIVAHTERVSPTKLIHRYFWAQRPA